MPKIYRWRELFSARGRYGRGEFWGTAIPIGLVNALLGAPAATSGRIVSLAILIAQVVLTVVCVNNNAKRLHDHGRSGWWQLVFLVPIFAAGFWTGLAGPQPISTVAVLIAAASGLIYLGCVPGQKTANRFGEPKLDTAQDRGDLPAGPPL